jgi:putative transposase
MPWSNDSEAAQRLRLVLAILSRKEPVAVLCRRFNVSRQTAYKYLARFHEEGRRGVRERSRRPKRADRLLAWRRRLRRLRRSFPTWGARKLRWRLRRLFPRARLPGERTMQRWLQQDGLTRRPVRKRAGRGPEPGRPRVARRSNDVWTVDFKGWFRTRDGRRVEPLTVRDLHSRYLLALTAVPDTGETVVRGIFRRLFKKFGLPRAIRSDRGAPFCGTGPHGLTRLSLWWHRLGIRVEFVDRASRLDNNAHEQMHRVLKAEVARHPERGLSAQQRRLGRWRHHYNHDRPHQALGQRTPASFYRPGPRRPVRLRPPRYPAGWLVRKAVGKGEISAGGRRHHVGRAFAGLLIGLKPVSGSLHHVFFGSLLLGSLDLKLGRPLRPFGAPLNP